MTTTIQIPDRVVIWLKAFRVQQGVRSPTRGIHVKVKRKRIIFEAADPFRAIRFSAVSSGRPPFDLVFKPLTFVARFTRQRGFGMKNALLFHCPPVADHEVERDGPPFPNLDKYFEGRDQNCCCNTVFRLQKGRIVLGDLGRGEDLSFNLVHLAEIANQIYPTEEIAFRSEEVSPGKEKKPVYARIVEEDLQRNKCTTEIILMPRETK